MQYKRSCNTRGFMIKIEVKYLNQHATNFEEKRFNHVKMNSYFWQTNFFYEFGSTIQFFINILFLKITVYIDICPSKLLEKSTKKIGGVVVFRRCGGLVRVSASRSPIPGSNLDLGPPHSVVWGAADHTVILYK